MSAHVLLLACQCYPFVNCDNCAGCINGIYQVRIIICYFFLVVSLQVELQNWKIVAV